MPVELVQCALESKLLLPGDTGFIITCKGKYQKHLNVQSVKFLERFTQRYFDARCTDEEKSAVEEETEMKEENGEEEKEQEPTNGELQVNEDGKLLARSPADIKFVAREIVYDTCSFIASNLSDPTDYLHFVFTLLNDREKREKKPRFPMKFMPVQMSCEARKRQAEQTTVSVLEKWIGQDGFPHRFSIACKGTTDGNWLKRREAASLVRNCIWSMNPNCVQCIKYQDFAIMIDILDPIFCVGVAKDFYSLGSYNSSAKPMTLRDTDSEDDISDDPNLDEEANKKRILRIKRKRRAEKAGLAQPESEEAKRCQGDEEEEEHGEEEEEEDGEDNVEEDQGE